MSAQPPPFAERLLRWSLSADDRQTVLGDLQEEFGAIEATHGMVAARRWYWWQVTSSIVPNLLRRGQQAWNVRRRTVDAEDQQLRQGARTFGMWIIGIGAAFGLVAWWWSDDPTGVVVGAPFAFIGVLLLIASLFRMKPRRRRRSEPWRTRLVGAVFWVTVAASFVGIHWPRWVGYIALACLGLIWLWPDRYWPRRLSSVTPAEYWVRTSAMSGYRERNGNVYVLTPVPATMLAVSRPILGRAVAARIAPEDAIPGLTPMNLTIDRTFDPSEVLRLVAVVNEKTGPVSAVLDVIDQAKRTVATLLATVTPATITRPVGGVWTIAEELDVDDTNAPPFGQIDVTVPLADLAPGRYCLRITAKDGFFTSEQDTDITVKAPTRN